MNFTQENQPNKVSAHVDCRITAMHLNWVQIMWKSAEGHLGHVLLPC